MKVVCDNCRAVYRVPDAKLTKAVNKATCRNCGHRMLIPRPKPGADPEERTLVTAVPPTPVGAPPRTDEQHGHTRPIPEGESESTLPGRQPDDLNVHTPMGADRRASDFDGPSTVVSDMPPGMPASSYSRQADSSQSTTVVQAPPPGVRQQPVPRSGPQAPRRTPMPAAPRRTPGPAPRRTPAMYSGGQAYDPSGDLNWALFGTGGALLGAVLLAFLSVYNHPLLMWFGLALAFGGGVLTFMVLVTGGRGRQPAKTLLSVVLGFIVAVAMSSGMVGLKVGAEVTVDYFDINFAQPPGDTTKPAMPVAAPAVPQPAPAAPGTPAPGNDGTAEVPAPETPEPAPAAPSPKPEQPKPSPAAPRPQPQPRPQPAPARPAPVPVPAPAPAGGMVTVPTDVIHVILSNNIDVKKCFVPMFQAGTLPPRVDVGFTILPAGNATKIALRSPPTLRGSALERCLQTVISRVSFPPTTGNGTVTVYPFILQ